jgi:hypothetical protein
MKAEATRTACALKTLCAWAATQWFLVTPDKQYNALRLYRKLERARIALDDAIKLIDTQEHST